MTHARIALAALVVIFFLTATQVEVDAAPHSPCRYEDGSGGPLPCIWDGRHMGNGVGRSYIMRRSDGDDPRQVFISHRRAHRLLYR